MIKAVKTHPSLMIGPNRPRYPNRRDFRNDESWWSWLTIAALLLLLLLAVAAAIVFAILYATKSTSSSNSEYANCKKLKQGKLPLTTDVPAGETECWVMVKNLNGALLPAGQPPVRAIGDGTTIIYGQGHTFASDCTRRLFRNDGRGLLKLTDIVATSPTQCVGVGFGVRIGVDASADISNCKFTNFSRGVFGIEATSVAIINSTAEGTMLGNFAGVNGFVYYGSGDFSVTDSTVNITNPQNFDFGDDYSIGIWTASFPYGTLPPKVTLDNVQSTASFAIQISSSRAGSVIRNSRTIITAEYPIAFAYGFATNTFDEYYASSLAIVNSSSTIDPAVPAAYGILATAFEVLTMDGFTHTGPTGYFPPVPTFGFLQDQPTGAIAIAPYPLESLTQPGSYLQKVVVTNSLLMPTSEDTPAIFIADTSGSNSSDIQLSVDISSTRIQSPNGGFGVFSAPATSNIYIGNNVSIDGPYFGVYFYNGTSLSQVRENNIANACVGVRVGGDINWLGSLLESANNEIKYNVITSGVDTSIEDFGTATEIESNTPADGTPCGRPEPSIPPLFETGSPALTGIAGPCGSHLLSLCIDE